MDSAGGVGVADVAADAPAGSDAGDAGGADGVADSGAAGGAVCAPGSFQCIDVGGSGAQYEWCNATGQWDICWCPGFCGAPQCSVQCFCHPGTTQCSGNGVQTCTDSWSWGIPVPCVNSACVSGACTGVCTPGATQCLGNGVQTCGATGNWGAAVPCAGGCPCVAGACFGGCIAGNTQCSGNAVQ